MPRLIPLCAALVAILLCCAPRCAAVDSFDLSGLLALNATCSQIDQIDLRCVDVGMGCNDTAGALVQASQGLPVFLCKQGLNCQVPPPGFPASSPFQCAITARIGELCSCASLDESCAALGCYERHYGVSCLNALCRGVNVYGPGEPAAFNAKGVCDRSSNAPFPNGGCVESDVVAESLICDSTTSTCSSVALGDSCAGDKAAWCRHDAYCHTASHTCVARATAAGSPCNSSQECAATLHCAGGACREWFAGRPGDACDVSEDCAVDSYCSVASGKCVQAVSPAEACTSPAAACSRPSEYCECDNGKGECSGDPNTAAHVTAWNALVACVAASKCFPVEPRGGVPVSLGGLSFFPGGCYDTFCRKEWLALTPNDAPCPTSAALARHPLLLLLLLSVAALLAALM